MNTQRPQWPVAMIFAGWLAALCLLTMNGLAGAAGKSTADHSKFKELQQTFQSGPEVTKACLSCHTEAAKQVHKTKHWTWEFLNPENKQRLGKRNVMNNFCISISQNYPFCTSCHIGYGWKDKDFDFSAENNVDCLVCHDTTGNYRKLPGLAGHPVTREMEFPPGSGKIVKPIDLATVAQKVGKTSRDNCGACHFFGGGGDGVKHGDMDSSLAAPDREVDVHMEPRVPISPAAPAIRHPATTCRAAVSRRQRKTRAAPRCAAKSIPATRRHANPVTGISRIRPAWPSSTITVTG